MSHQLKKKKKPVRVTRHLIIEEKNEVKRTENAEAFFIYIVKTTPSHSPQQTTNRKAKSDLASASGIPVQRKLSDTDTSCPAVAPLRLDTADPARATREVIVDVDCEES